MTSGIPSYTYSAEFWRDVAAAPDGLFPASRLVSYALSLPRTRGYSYSNTNYILLQMIIERAAHDSYSSQLCNRIISPLKLRNVFYSATNYARAITDRLPAGYWHIPLPGMSLNMAATKAAIPSHGHRVRAGSSAPCQTWRRGIAPCSAAGICEGSSSGS